MNSAYYDMLALLQQQTLAVIRSNVQANAAAVNNNALMARDASGADPLAKRTSTIKLKKRPCF